MARPVASAPGYELSRLSSFCGQWMRHGDWYPDRVLRLFRRDAGRFSDDQVHEHVMVNGPVARLPGELLHDTMPTLGHALWAFVRGYLLRRGFLDGRLGFVLALHVAEGTYYRYLKMWLLARGPAALMSK